MRTKLWFWLSCKHPPDRVLTRKLLLCKAILFPKEFLLWWLQRDCGYDILMDTWWIYGVEYSSAIFHHMSQGTPDGVWMKIEVDPSNPKMRIVATKRFEELKENK